MNYSHFYALGDQIILFVSSLEYRAKASLTRSRLQLAPKRIHDPVRVEGGAPFPKGGGGSSRTVLGQPWI